MAPIATPAAGTVKPPDGGWGWVVVGCVFFVRFMSFGTLLSVGVAFDLLMEEFNCTKSQISVIASLSFSLQCFLGPITSMLQDRFGTRAVVFVGTLTISICFILSSFAPNVYYLYVSFGVIGGIGMGLVYLSVMVVISYYFDKKRTFATALGGIGAYAGCFVHPYLMRYMISVYGWRGAFFVIGALTLNSLPAAMLLRPLTASKKKPGEEDAEKNGQVERNNSEAYRLETFIEENVAGCNNGETIEQSTEKRGSAMRSPRLASSSFVAQKPPLDEPRGPPSARDRALSDRWGGGDATSFATRFQRAISAISDIRLESPTLERANSVFESSDGIYSPINPAKDRSRTSTMVRSVSERHGTSVAIAEEGEAEEEEKEKMEKKPLASHLNVILDVFKIPECTAFILANLLIGLVYYTPSLFIIDWGKSIGIPPERTTVLLSFVGLGNIFGRPIVAFIGDFFHSHRILLFSILAVTSGAITAVTPLFASFPFMALFVLQYAVLIGGTQTLLTPILADLVPLHKLGFAFGILLACQGTGMLVGPPVLVLFPSYAITFTIVGFILITCGLLMAGITYGKRLFEDCTCSCPKSSTGQASGKPTAV